MLDSGEALAHYGLLRHGKKNEADVKLVGLIWNNFIWWN
jgi:hypothetical protein